MNAIIATLEPLYKGDPQLDQALPTATWLNAFGDYYIELGMLVRMLVYHWEPAFRSLEFK